MTTGKAAVSYSEHPWTFRLIGLNLAIYLLIETGIAVDGGQQLIFMYGLFNSQAILAGEWWRLLTATLLHADFMHLLFNMIAMLIFGSMLEKIAGPSLYLLVYFVGGVAANLIVLCVLVALNKPYLSLGASGSIMSIIGASFSCALYIYWRTRQEYWRLFFIRMAIILGLQFGIDVLLPNNSMMTHIAGGVSGMILGMIVIQVKTKGLRQTSV